MFKSRTAISQLAATTAVLLGVRYLVRHIRQRRIRQRPVHQSERAADYLAARTKILVIGAGFGGLGAVLELDRLLGGEPGEPQTSVLLIDRDNNLFFTPLLWTVSDGRSNPNSVVVPIRTLQRGRRFHALYAEALRIDLEKRQVETTAGPRPYDTLVVDCGSVTAVPELPGVPERALLFRTPVEALQLRNRLIESVERAHQAEDPHERQAWLTFVVAGGGDTGVELAATIHDYLHSGLLAAYPWLRAAPVQVIVIGRADRLVPMSTPATSDAVRRVLESEGIEVRTGVSVTGAADDVIHTTAGDIRARTLFWAAGITAPDLVRELPVEHAKNGAVLVDDHLRVPGHPEVYVIGDSAWAHDSATGNPIPPTAQAAEHEGKYVGRAIVCTLRGGLGGGQAPPFRFKPLGHMALLGTYTGVSQIGPFIITGLSAWLMWHGYYWIRIPSWRNRVHLLTDWALAAVFGREIAQVPLDASG